MELSSELVSQFAKLTNDSNQEKKDPSIYGTVVLYEGKQYVKLDGSDRLTPMTSTTVVGEGDRVIVAIKNHSAIVTGDITSPSASDKDVQEIGTKISEFETVIADKVTADELEVEKARIDDLIADNVTIKDGLIAANASIDELEAKDVTISGDLTSANAEIENLKTNKLDASVADLTYATIESLDATNANIRNLDADYGSFKDLTTEKLTVNEASIKELNTNKLDATAADLKYANIDFSNIGEAAIEKIFSDSGIIKDLIVSEGKITGELVGVTIKGDLIEGNTIVADKLVVKGEDGLYYKLNTDGVTTEAEQTDYNSLNGTVIQAKSITAEKVAVNDLVAFGATIGGFNITENSLYSGTKSSADNTTLGIYLDNTGQAYFGDSNNYLRFYQDSDGTYKLDISAASILLGTSNKSVETAIDEVLETVNDQSTSILSDCESIILTAVDECVKTGDYSQFKKTVETQFSILSDEIEMRFTENSEEIDSVNGELQSNLTQLYKHISFSEDGIIIKSGENSIELQLDNNDGIIFSKNGVPFGSWDGVDFHTGNIVVDVEERAQLGNFAFVPRSDGSLMFMRVSD